MSGFLNDVRYALRGIRRKPMFSAILVVTLALGIGVNTAIFSAVNTFLLEPLKFEEPDRIVRGWTTDPEHGSFALNSSWPDFVDLRRETRSLSHVAAIGNAGMTLSGDGEAVRLSGVRVSEDFFHV